MESTSPAWQQTRAKGQLLHMRSVVREMLGRFALFFPNGKKLGLAAESEMGSYIFLLVFLGLRGLPGCGTS